MLQTIENVPQHPLKRPEVSDQPTEGAGKEVKVALVHIEDYRRYTPSEQNSWRWLRRRSTEDTPWATGLRGSPSAFELVSVSSTPKKEMKVAQ
jgi:hypothetical protein